MTLNDAKTLLPGDRIEINYNGTWKIGTVRENIPGYDYLTRWDNGTWVILCRVDGQNRDVISLIGGIRFYR